MMCLNEEEEAWWNVLYQTKTTILTIFFTPPQSAKVSVVLPITQTIERIVALRGAKSLIPNWAKWSSSLFYLDSAPKCDLLSFETKHQLFEVNDKRRGDQNSGRWLKSVMHVCLLQSQPAMPVTLVSLFSIDLLVVNRIIDQTWSVTRIFRFQSIKSLCAKVLMWPLVHRIFGNIATSICNKRLLLLSFSTSSGGRRELSGLKVPGFWIRQFLRHYIRMPFLPTTHGCKPRELADTPRSRMPGRNWTYDL